MNIELANTSLYVLPMFRWFCGDLKKGRAVFKDMDIHRFEQGLMSPLNIHD